MPVNAGYYLSYLTSEKSCVDALKLYYWSAWRDAWHKYEWTGKWYKIRPRCPYCNGYRVRGIRKEKLLMRYQCNRADCRKQFNLFTCTPFSRTKIPIRKWFEAYYYKRHSWRTVKWASKIDLRFRDAKNLDKRLRRFSRKDWAFDGARWLVKQRDKCISIEREGKIDFRGEHRLASWRLQRLLWEKEQGWSE